MFVEHSDAFRSTPKAVACGHISFTEEPVTHTTTFGSGKGTKYVSINM